MSTALFIPNFQNFAEALASGRYVFDIIDRVNNTLLFGVDHECLLSFS